MTFQNKVLYYFIYKRIFLVFLWFKFCVVVAHGPTLGPFLFITFLPSYKKVLVLFETQLLMSFKGRKKGKTVSVD